MNILITGHKGFIGKNLWLYFSKLGYNVSGWEWGDSRELDLNPDLDWVIHTGAISSTTETDADKLLLQNTDFTTDLIVQCLEKNINIQYASSASVYGNANTFEETAVLRPLNSYAWSKYLVDRFVEQAIKLPLPISVQGFRYFNVYGRFENHKGNQASPISKFTQEALHDDSIKLFEGSEHFKRDFVCVNDVARVHRRMMDVDQNGIFNVGTGIAVSFDHVAKMIAGKFSVPINHITIPINLRSQYQEYTQADNSKLMKYIDMEWTTLEDYLDV